MLPCKAFSRYVWLECGKGDGSSSPDAHFLDQAAFTLGVIKHAVNHLPKCLFGLPLELASSPAPTPTPRDSVVSSVVPRLISHLDHMCLISKEVRLSGGWHSLRIRTG